MRSSADVIDDRTSIVTAAPSLRKIMAYSMAMMPLPTMTTDLGRKPSVLIESASKTRRPSNGTPPTRMGTDPQHTRSLAPATSTQPAPPTRSTLTLPSPSSVAVPCW